MTLGTRICFSSSSPPASRQHSSGSKTDASRPPGRRYTSQEVNEAIARRIPEAAIRALVFDFDGLILDTETAEHQAWQELYRQHGTELPLERWVECIGTSTGEWSPYDQLERQIGELVDRDRLRRGVTTRTAEILADRSTLPGVTEFIDRAGELSMPIGVASSSSRSWVESHLMRLGLHGRFDAIRCSDDVDNVKPDPEVYLNVCQALGAEPRASVAVEDSPNGIRAAKAAGLYCVSVPNALTRNLSMDTADLVLVSLVSVTLDDVLERANVARRRTG
jgi:HAD superfamily hydrolase (TIGR01509 family)